jgi:CO dehydrogenase/acetyl-CoA synthase gamma subunit (corrinoid Fe-S protein)
MAKADLYLAKMDICRYWPKNAPIRCEDCLNKLKAGENLLRACPFLTARQADTFKLVSEAESYLPSIPQMTVPQPIQPGLFPVNEPDKSSLVIVSGNSQHTFEVLATVWAQGLTPAYFLLVDCLGNTVDMAMIFGDFTANRLLEGMSKTGLEQKVGHRHMIVPGLTSPLAGDFAAATGWEIEVGPICAVELPLFLGDRWSPPLTDNGPNSDRDFGR